MSFAGILQRLGSSTRGVVLVCGPPSGNKVCKLQLDFTEINPTISELDLHNYGDVHPAQRRWPREPVLELDKLEAVLQRP